MWKVRVLVFERWLRMGILYRFFVGIASFEMGLNLMSVWCLYVC